jgi:hypothetical protein
MPQVKLVATPQLRTGCQIRTSAVALSIFSVASNTRPRDIPVCLLDPFQLSSLTTTVVIRTKYIP